ncbi:hypothetical protein WMY93_013075 [Mugilogobius chulae]|uniref:Uncharacterized protein n=1 Tax=Mugilogobius chulae TaxID=88201 RepID=A0AAW0PAJ3_9GOBI
MYVLCTLAALTIHSLLKNRLNKAVEGGPDAEEKKKRGGQSQDGAAQWGLGQEEKHYKPRPKRRRGAAVSHVQSGQRKGQFNAEDSDLDQTSSAPTSRPHDRLIPQTQSPLDLDTSQTMGLISFTEDKRKKRNTLV